MIAADKNLSNVKDTVSIIPKDNTQTHFPMEIDVGDDNSIKQALQTTLQHFKKPPSVIVNSAGITKDNFLVKLSINDFDEVIKINLKVKLG